MLGTRALAHSARMCLIPRGFIRLTSARKRFTLGRGGAKLVVGRDDRMNKEAQQDGRHGADLSTG